MPTPNDSILRLPAATLNLSSPRHSCPPDGERSYASMRNLDNASDASSEGAPDSNSSDSETTRLRYTSSATTLSSVSHLSLAKQRLAEEIAPLRDTPSPISTTEDGSDVDSRAALPVSSAADEIALFPNGILGSPYPKTRYIPNSTSSFLRPGSRFTGTQQSDRQVYEVQVDLKHVDMEESFLCGYLRIQGLTDDHPTLTTYFEGEIVGNKYTFQTNHPEWGATDKVDTQHWNRFEAWRPLARASKKSDFSYKDWTQKDNIFMRWKEYFLVPDHRVRTISGASFEGFYYICFNQASGTISGIYFHAKSEKYQQLELKHVPDNGCMGAFEFT